MKQKNKEKKQIWEKNKTKEHVNSVKCKLKERKKECAQKLKDKKEESN